MRRHVRIPSAFFVALLFGIVSTAGVGSVQTTAAQQPSLNLDQPVQSIEQSTATMDTDAGLVDLATAWMKARANTEISYSTYRKGVRVFQEKKPGFYGNFFGDPFYATYDVDYFKMRRYRRLASQKVNPQHGLSGLFSCSPLTYDPAFNGQCRGFQFAAADFFILPSGSIPVTSSSVTPLNLQSLSVCQDGHESANRCASLYAEESSHEDRPEIDLPNRPDEQFVRPDTAQRSLRRPSTVAEAAPAPSQSPTASIDNDNSSPRTEPVQTRSRLSPRIDDEVARKVNESIQRRAASLKRVEQRIRIRQRIRKKFGSPESLTPEERARISSQLAERKYSRNDRSWTRDRERTDVRSRLERLQSSPAQVKRRSGASNSNIRNRSTADRPENNSAQHRKPKQKRTPERRRKPKPKKDLEESENN